MSDTILSSPPGEQIHLVINKMTEDQYQQLVGVSADMLSTELSNEIFLTYSDSGEEGGGIPPASYKTYDDTLSSLSGDGYATQQWVGSQGFSTDSVNNAMVTFKQGKVVKGSITLNQASDSVITLDGESEETERFSSQAVLQACSQAVVEHTPSIVESELYSSNRQLTESLVDQIAEAVLKRIQDAGIGREAVDYAYPTFHPTFTSSMYANKITFNWLSAIPSALVMNGDPIGGPIYDSTDPRMPWRTNPIYVDPAIYPDPQLIAVELNPTGATQPVSIQNEITSNTKIAYGIYTEVPDSTGGVTYFPIYQTSHVHEFHYSFVAFPGMKFGFFTNQIAVEAQWAGTIFGLSAASPKCIGSITILNNQGFAEADPNYMMFNNDYLSSSSMTLADGALVSPVGFIKSQRSNVDTVTLVAKPPESEEWIPLRSVTKNYYGLTAETSFGRFWLPAGSEIAFRCNSPLILNGTMKASDGNLYKCGQARILSSVTAFAQPNVSCELSGRFEFTDNGNMLLLEHKGFLPGAYMRFRYNDDPATDCGYYVSAANSITDDYYMDTASISNIDFSISSNGTIGFNKGASGTRGYLTQLKIGKIAASQYRSLNVQDASSLYSVELPSDIAIKSYEFKNCTVLSSVKIGDLPPNVLPLSAFSSGYWSFQNTNLKNISIEIDNNNYYSTNYSNIFANCKNLSAIRIYSNSSYIHAHLSGYNATTGCDNLRKIEEIYGPAAVGNNNYRFCQWWAGTNYVTDVLISSCNPITYYLGESLYTSKNLSNLTIAGISSFYGNTLQLPYSGPDMRFNLSGSTIKSLPSIIYGNTVKHIDLPSTLISIASLNSLTSLTSVFFPTSVSSYTTGINGMHQLSTGGISFETDQISNVVKVLTNRNYASDTTSYATTIYNGNGTIPVYYEATRTSQGTMLGQLTKTAFNITNA